MSSLFKHLPSFATDYSGFISLVHGLGGLMVVHDPSGCLGNYTNTDEPRWYDDPQPVFSSNIGELEAVIGDTSSLVEKIKNEIERKRPPFCCIFGTPVPSLTGCDISSVALEIENLTGVKCRAVETNGFRFYDDGIEKATNFILDELIGQNTKKIPGTVNVIGMTPLDYPTDEKEKIIKVLAEENLTVSSFIGMGNDLEAIKNAAGASLNLVMCAAALPMAKRMKEKYGIDYRLGPPSKKEAFSYFTDNIKDNDNILIFGEQLCSDAIRNVIRELNPTAKVTVATFFTLLKELAEPDDIKLSTEKQLEKLIAGNNYDVVIADPLVEHLCTPKQLFLANIHPALSSKIYWHDTKSYIY